MAKSLGPSIGEHFRHVEDPRIHRTRFHSLNDILVIALCGVVCGADDWVALERFGKAKLGWFRTFLDLPNGIPSHDTFGRVFAALDPESFKAAFLSWVSALAEVLPADVVAVDGKTLRHTFDTAAGKGAIHMVSAWASRQGICLGQMKTDAKSNEITAIPKLLDVLALQGCIVTIDAMGCQKEIAAKIRDKGADYLLSLKGNQGLFHEDIKAFLEDAHSDGFQDIPHTYTETTDGDHGRIEIRRVWATEAIDWLEGREAWKDLRSLALVESERILGDKTTRERRMFISSLPGDATRIAPAIRAHWGVENGLHWVLDVAMNQDQTRIPKDHAPENLAILHHIALNLLKQERTAKLGIKNKRLASAWDHDYLLKVLGVARS